MYNSALHAEEEVQVGQSSLLLLLSFTMALSASVYNIILLVQ